MRAVLVLVVALVAGLIAWHYWTSEEDRIRARLAELASAAGTPADETPLARVGRLATLNRGLTDDARFEGGPGLPSLEGREAFVGFASQAAALGPYTITVEGADVTIDGMYATVQVTVRVSGLDDGPQRRRFDGQEFEVELKKPDDEWLVTRVTPLSALKPVG